MRCCAGWWLLYRRGICRTVTSGQSISAVSTCQTKGLPSSALAQNSVGLGTWVSRAAIASGVGLMMAVQTLCSLVRETPFRS